MQGKGTKADPYRPESWEDFAPKTTVSYGKQSTYNANNTVYFVFPENAVWDLTGKDINNNISLFNVEIEANNLTIKGARFWASSSSGEIFTCYSQTTVKHLNFEDCTVYQNTILFCSYGNLWQNGRGIILKNCTYIGSSYGGVILKGSDIGSTYTHQYLATHDDEKGCYFKVLFDYNPTTFNPPASLAAIALGYGTIEDSYVETGGGKTDASWRLPCTRCFICGTLPTFETQGSLVGNKYCYVSGTSNVIDLQLSPDQSDQYYLQVNSPTSVCVSDASNSYVTAIKVSEEQLKDAFYLRTHEFDIKTLGPFEYGDWRIEPYVNHGKPCHEYLRVEVEDRPPDPPPMWVQERPDSIIVYDMSEPQSGFDSNGMAILSPSSCKSIRNADKWEISLTHPVDDWGKWKYLLAENVLKVNGQLFRIYKYKPRASADGMYIDVQAKHISCDMADDLITEAYFGGGTPQDFINFAFDAGIMKTTDWYYEPYHFTGVSDIQKTLPPCNYVNVSLWASIVSDDKCLLNLCGGEIYRDNFYFSVKERMENAKDNAFFLRYSFDMEAVSMEIDYSSLCTNLDGVDNFGSGLSISYTHSANWAIHHARRKMYQFNYTDGSNSLGSDVTALWNQISAPTVTVTVKFAAMGNDPRYADFKNLQNYNYGDRGTIYCPELDIMTEQQIVEVEKDELSGKIISMVLGNIQSSLVRPTFMGGTISSGNSVEDKQTKLLRDEIKQTTLKMLSTWNGAKAFKWSEVKKYKWKEVSRNG